MKKQVTRCLILAVAVFALCGAAHAGGVQWDSYAIKWVCGNVSDESGAIATDGRYNTTINIHNPHYLQDVGLTRGGGPLDVIFYKKVVLAYPQGQPKLPHSCYFQERLFPDEALAVTCSNIKTQLALSGLPSSGVQEGFVVLQVPPGQDPAGDPDPPLLDVTALYTGRSRAAGADVRLNGVSTWDVETVDPIDMRGFPPVIFFCD